MENTMKVVILTAQAIESINALVEYCSSNDEIMDFVCEPHESHIMLEAYRASYALGNPLSPTHIIDYLKENNFSIDEEEWTAIEEAASYVKDADLRVTILEQIFELKKRELELKRAYKNEREKPLRQAVENGDAMMALQEVAKMLSITSESEYDDIQKQYTVIGYYVDNDQPWMGEGYGLTPQEAVRDATFKLEANVKVVEVILGSVEGTLFNNEVMDPEDIDPS
jgi:hypothetical protein